MAYKKHNWVGYGNNGEDTIEITIKDCTDRKLDFMRVRKKNSDEVARIINKRYGFFPKTFKEEKATELKKEVDEELDFLKKEMGW